MNRRQRERKVEPRRLMQLLREELGAATSDLVRSPALKAGVSLFSIFLCSCQGISTAPPIKHLPPPSYPVQSAATASPAPVIPSGRNVVAAPSPAPVYAPVSGKALAGGSAAGAANSKMPAPGTTSISGKTIQQTAYSPPTLPPEAWTGAPGMMPSNAYPANCPPANCPPGGDENVIVNYPNPWKPDGLPGPWPYDEYIYDGGDRAAEVTVRQDWSIRGLDNEDTVAHYDTRDGRTIVTPSNRVPIYAPRFAAVRKVYGLEINEGKEHIAGMDKPLRLNSQDTQLLATTTVQPQQPILQHGIKTSVGLRERSRGVGLETAFLPVGLESNFLPHEDFLLIKRGEFDASEKARLTARIQAAYTWSQDQSVQVTIEGQLAHEGKLNNAAEETLTYELPPGKPRLRIVKVASKSEAKVGEIIDFTLRFDNVGDQKVGNVTIVDSLTTRLEYVPDSAQCSHKANFGTVENEAESLVLRWEILDPMRVGEGGIIRFKCKVR